MWVTMLKRPDFSMNRCIFSLARKFNSILEDVIVGDKRSHILKIRVDHNLVNFDSDGYLMPSGKLEYWRALDHDMKQFDCGDTELQLVRSTPPSSSVVATAPPWAVRDRHVRREDVCSSPSFNHSARHNHRALNHHHHHQNQFKWSAKSHSFNYTTV